MMKSILVVASVLVVAMALPKGVACLMADDKESRGQERLRRENLERFGETYRKRSGKDPTVENVYRTLLIEDAQGKQRSEMTSALILITAMEVNRAEAVSRILACYDKNQDGHIRNFCAYALVVFDRDRGLALSRKILECPDTDVNDGLDLGRLLVGQKTGIGYLTLGRGLVSPSRGVRMRALMLFDGLLPYDGTSYGLPTEKVDLPGAIATARKTLLAMQADLDKAASKLEETPNEENPK